MLSDRDLRSKSLSFLVYRKGRGEVTLRYDTLRDEQEQVTLTRRADNHWHASCEGIGLKAASWINLAMAVVYAIGYRTAHRQGLSEEILSSGYVHDGNYSDPRRD